jgi:hypothetical protein
MRGHRREGRPRGQRQEHHGRAHAGGLEGLDDRVRGKGAQAADAVAALAKLVEDKFGEER